MVSQIIAKNNMTNVVWWTSLVCTAIRRCTLIFYAFFVTSMRKLIFCKQQIYVKLFVDWKMWTTYKTCLTEFLVKYYEESPHTHTMRHSWLSIIVAGRLCNVSYVVSLRCREVNFLAACVRNHVWRLEVRRTTGHFPHLFGIIYIPERRWDAQRSLHTACRLITRCCCGIV